MTESIAVAPVPNEVALKLCQKSDTSTKEFILQHTMFRIKDPKKTIPFYTGVLGMKLLLKLDFPNMNYSMYIIGHQDEKDFQGELGSNERLKWARLQKPIIELTHNWGTENNPKFKYHVGNSEPKGFGHMGILVPDLDEACERFQALGVDFIKRPQNGSAFIADPDGYWIEIVNNKNI